MSLREGFRALLRSLADPLLSFSIFPRPTFVSLSRSSFLLFHRSLSDFHLLTIQQGTPAGEARDHVRSRFLRPVLLFGWKTDLERPPNFSCFSPSDLPSYLEHELGTSANQIRTRRRQLPVCSGRKRFEGTCLFRPKGTTRRRKRKDDALTLFSFPRTGSSFPRRARLSPYDRWTCRWYVFFCS